MRIAVLAGAVLCLCSIGCDKQPGFISENAASPRQALKVDHVSAKGAALSMHKAIEARDFDAIVECIDPAVRGSFKTALFSARNYINKLNELAALADQRIAPDAGDDFRKDAERTYHNIIVSPLEKAAADGQVDWGKVQIDAFDDRADVTVDYKPTDFSKRLYLRRIRGDWFVASREAPEMLKSKAEGAQATFDHMTDAANETAKRIRDGRINAENFKDATSRKSTSRPG